MAMASQRIKPNPAYEVFCQHLTNAKWSKWGGVAFRAAPLQYGRLTRLLDGRGALKFGGRWSAPGSFRAVNLSTTQEAAVAESNGNFAHYNLQCDIRPKVVVGVQLSLRKVLDLVSPKGIVSENWVRIGALLSEDWREANDFGCEAITQALGRAAHDCGADGLLTPSARISGATNIVFFLESIIADASVKILGQDELDRWLKKR